MAVNRCVIKKDILHKDKKRKAEALEMFDKLEKYNSKGKIDVMC